MATAEHWNTHYPVGTPVHAWPGIREDEPLVTRTTSTAWVLGGHTPVVRVADHSACIALTHVDALATDSTDEGVSGV